MKVLILGGTQFVGRAITEAALSAGHDVTLFNRGNTNPELFPDVEKLRGDRSTADGLSVLNGRKWDAVIDVNGYLPRVVRMAAHKLAHSARYAFISTISVYDDAVHTTPQINEDAPLATLEDDSVEEITGETYGGLKVLCERAVRDTFEDRAVIVRPGLVVGPTDHTDRFTYWPIHTARGGKMLIPPRQSALQVIDVRDLAAFTLHLVENGDDGTYHATGPAEPLTYGRMLDACQQAAGDSAAEYIEATEEFLLQHVQPWSDLPLWLPQAGNGMMQVDNRRAINAGLSFRPIEQTVADILAWFKAERGLYDTLRAGLSSERQAELLVLLEGGA